MSLIKRYWMLEKKKEYIDQLLKDLRLLEERVSSIKDNDSLPFSFFKESFDKIQEVSKVLHLLEFMQIDDMRGQMERLVHFLSETENRVTSATRPAEAARKAEPVHVAPVADQSAASVAGPFVMPVISQPVMPVASQPAAPVEPHKVEREKTVAIKGERVEIGPRNQYAQGIVLPEYRNPNPPEKDTAAGGPIPEVKRSLNDVIAPPPPVVDLKPSISLNDRFLFQRELFRNDRQEMDRTMHVLSMFETFQEVEEYVMGTLSWDFENPTVNNFLAIIKKGFAQ